MSAAASSAPNGDTGERKPFMERMLDGIERVGNKVPHPVLMFLYLIGFVIILSQILAWFDVSVTEFVAEPVPVEVYRTTTKTRSSWGTRVRSLPSHTSIWWSARSRSKAC